MKMVFHNLRLFGLLAAVVIESSIAGAATIHKNDDTIVNGDLQAVTGGKLTVLVNNTPVVIALDDISQIIIKEPPAPVVAKPPVPVVQNDQEDGPNLGAALFGALFSGARPNTAPAAGANTPVALEQGSPSTKPATTQHFVAPSVQLNLTDGDQFHAGLDQWENQELSLHLNDGTKLEVSSSLITQMWFGNHDQQIKALALTVSPGPEDVAYVAKDSDIIAVKGLAQGIVGEALQFRYGDQDRKIGLSKLVGLQLRSNTATPLPGFHQAVACRW